MTTALAPVRRRTPQIVIVESPTSTVDRGVWKARFLNPRATVVDVGWSFGQRSAEPQVRRWFAEIREIGPEHFQLCTEVNGARGGRRYRFFRTYPEAVAALLAWTGRRFRVVD